MDKKELTIPHAEYVVAFLAAIFSLGAFKDELYQSTFYLFGVQISWFWPLAVFAGLLLLSAYITAIALVISSIFTRLSIGTMIIFAKWIAAFALIGLPAIFMSLLFSSFWMSFQPTWSQTFDLINSLISSVIGVLAALISYKFTKVLNRSESLSLLRSAKTDAEKISDNSIIANYNLISRFAKNYLKARGFNVGEKRLSFMAELLESKDIFTKSDVEFVKWLEGSFNEGDGLSAELEKSERARCDKLVSKIEEAFTSFMRVEK